MGYTCKRFWSSERSIQHTLSAGEQKTTGTFSHLSLLCWTPKCRQEIISVYLSYINLHSPFISSSILTKGSSENYQICAVIENWPGQRYWGHLTGVTSLLPISREIRQLSLELFMTVLGKINKKKALAPARENSCAFTVPFCGSILLSYFPKPTDSLTPLH